MSSSTSPKIHIEIQEKDVLRLIAMSYSHREISEQLQTDLQTVEAVKAKAMKKLGLQSRIDVIRYAQRQGWIE